METSQDRKMGSQLEKDGVAQILKPSHAIGTVEGNVVLILISYRNTK